MRMILLELCKDVAQCAAHSARLLRAATRDDRRSEAGGKGAGELFSDVNERSDQAEFALTRPSYGWKRADAARKHSVAQERFTEIVGSVSKRDHVCAELSSDFVHCAAAKPATQVAAVVRTPG